MKEARSADGTPIAFEVVGQGPPVILVPGAFSDRKARAAGAPLAALLASRFEVVSYDRRGRGDSGDGASYAILREVEDLAELLADVGGSAFVYGMSSGALLALDAAARGLAISKLALYEPPLILDTARQASRAGLPAELAALAKAGKRADAVELFCTKGMGLPPPAVAQMRAAPFWGALEALAHTLEYDARIAEEGPRLVERIAAVRAKTLVLTGGASPPWFHEGARAIVAALPDGRVRVLEKQTHDVDPKLLASALAEFFAE